MSTYFVPGTVSSDAFIVVKKGDKNFGSRMGYCRWTDIIINKKLSGSDKCHDVHKTA